MDSGTLEARQSLHGELLELNSSGETKLIWSKDNADEVENARQTFVRLRTKGFAAYSVKKVSGNKGEIITEFNPDAERIIMAPPMRGG